MATLANSHKTLANSHKIPYNLSEKVIHYTNDFEYRAWLRYLFCMRFSDEDEDNKNNGSTPITDEDDDIDIITRDELDYNEQASIDALDYVYVQTKDNTLFQELYSLAASKMLSLDRNIGLSVLYSYDYMALFHCCVCCYIEKPDEFDETNEWFTCLRKKLT